MVIVIINTRNWINCVRFLLWFFFFVDSSHYFVFQTKITNKCEAPSTFLLSCQCIVVGRISTGTSALQHVFFFFLINLRDVSHELKCAFLLFEYRSFFHFFSSQFFSVLNVLHVSDIVSIIKSIHTIALINQRGKRTQTQTLSAQQSYNPTPFLFANPVRTTVWNIMKWINSNAM